MVEDTLVTILSYALSLFYGFAAIFLVFETRNRCPFRWPLLFGSIGSVSHIVLHEVPPWWPPRITRDMLLAFLLLAIILLGVELLRRIINEHGLRYPWEPFLGWYQRHCTDDEVTAFDRFR